jgi:hypothetical protein
MVWRCGRACSAESTASSGSRAVFFAPLVILAGRLRARLEPQMLQSMSSALTAPCPFAADAPPKGAAKTEK